MDPAALTQFASITGCSNHIAAQYLGLADGDAEQAIELYFANGGAELQTAPTDFQQSDSVRSAPSQPSHSQRQNRGYQDEDGVVHLDDSEPEDQDFVDEDENGLASTEPQKKSLRSGSRPGRESESQNNLPHQGQPDGAAIDNDEAMARRLQEEYYGATGHNAGSTNGSSEMLDDHGYRAPIGRTTETLIGPGSLDPSNAEEMRAAVLDQMARRQQPRPRGKLAPILIKAF